MKTQQRKMDTRTRFQHFLSDIITREARKKEEKQQKKEATKDKKIKF